MRHGELELARRRQHGRPDRGNIGGAPASDASKYPRSPTRSGRVVRTRLLEGNDRPLRLDRGGFATLAVTGMRMRRNLLYILAIWLLDNG